MMWMMGYNDGGDFNNIQDPFTGRKLRPLMPRPAPCLTRIHGADHFLGLNPHLAMVEQNKRELTSQQVVVTSRWNPTPEQLQTLEELYRRGTRTPTAEQIQQITSQLRRYGKIEGKNVFYWFQNHKARERQKRRRQLESHSDEQQQPNDNNNNNNNNNQTEKGEKIEEPPGSNRTAYEVEQTKNWASPTNSSTIAEKTTQGATTRVAEAAECKLSDGWPPFDDAAAAEILSQQRRNATWHLMNLSSSSISSSSSHPTISTAIPPPPTPLQDILRPHCGFIDIFGTDLDRSADEAAQTLQLFPLQSGRGLSDDEDGGGSGGDMPMSGGASDHVATTPYQFFEFLPMKN